MYVFILITHVFQGESSGINICKEVIIIEFREHYQKKKKISQETEVQDQRASQVSPAKHLEES